MSLFKYAISPLLDCLDSERMHDFARNSLKIVESSPVLLKATEFICCGKRFVDPRLQVNVAGIDFENPIVVGAGWDKLGVAVNALWQLGFAGVEIGSVLVKPQAGNPKPRQFMISPGVAINRLGFPSIGMEAVAINLTRYRHSHVPIGINIGLNKEVSPKDAPTDYAQVALRLSEFAAYYVINVSSPNTPGLRKLQDKSQLEAIVQAVRSAIKTLPVLKPLFVKISPELSFDAIDDVIQVVKENSLDGIIATNTLATSEAKAKYGSRWENEAGGISGNDPELIKLSTQIISHIFQQTKGDINIIGVGGIHNVETALSKIQAGAKLLQIVTAIRSEGPGVASQINRGIVSWMNRYGVSKLTDIVGVSL